MTYDISSKNFVCKHYENECSGNLYIMCANNLMKREKYNEFIICFFDYIKYYGLNVEETSRFCSSNQDLKNCVESNQGRSLADNILNRKNMLNINFNHSPLVMVNDKFDYDEEYNILNDLKSYICKKYGYNIQNCLDS